MSLAEQKLPTSRTLAPPPPASKQKTDKEIDGNEGGRMKEDRETGYDPTRVFQAPWKKKFSFRRRLPFPIQFNPFS